MTASQPDVLGMIQQNSLLVIGALGLLAVLIAVIALKRRGGGHTYLQKRDTALTVGNSGGIED